MKKGDRQSQHHRNASNAQAGANPVIHRFSLVVGQPKVTPRMVRSAFWSPQSVSNPDSLNLVERHQIRPPVIEAGSSRRLVIGHLLRHLNLATGREVFGDAGGSEGVVRDARL